MDNQEGPHSPSSSHLTRLTGCRESESAAFVLEGVWFLVLCVFLFLVFDWFLTKTLCKCEGEICPLVSVDQAENNVVSLSIQLGTCL